MKKERIVIKIGTGSLRSNGHPSIHIFYELARQIAEIKKEGYEVFVISSGAVDAGREWLMLLGRDFSQLNSGELSSIGTSRLLRAWEDAFMPHGLAIATAWMTHGDWRIRRHKANLRRSGRKLSGEFPYAVPIGNENDLFSRVELDKMRQQKREAQPPKLKKKKRKKQEDAGDNDYLGRKVTMLLDFDAYLILTESGGIYNGDPADPKSRRYNELDGRTTFQLRSKNGGTSDTGTGGPQSKINQASYCFRRGKRSAIAGVHEPNVVVRFAHRELVGTTISTRTVLSIA